MNSIKKEFTGTTWFVEGDIKGCFDNINHHVLVDIIGRKIKDARLIKLVWKFLRAGYIEDWKYHTTYSGSPQGGIISPILENIYLNELDKFAETTAKSFYKKRDRVRTKEYDKLIGVLTSVKKLLKTATGQQKSDLLKQRKELQKQLRNRFYRGKYSTGVDGVGIGLYLTHDIMTKQKGYIKVISNDTGTTFSLFFRLYVEE